LRNVLAVPSRRMLPEVDCSPNGRICLTVEVEWSGV
jgi:hypothetical protein